MSLQEVLVAHRPAVMERWLDEVRGTLHPETVPRVELIDHLPKFLDHVIRVLAQETGSDDGVDIAEQHGGQRLALGFSLDSVVREYGAMRAAILAAAVEHRIALTARDLEVIFHCIVDAIAGAVSEYSRQRDAELQRQATEHFAFIAHELRNPLSSSLLALSSLHSRGRLDRTDRTVQVLDRGLRAVGEMIDHSLRIARFGTGPDLTPEPVQLRKLLDDTVAAVALSAEAKEITLEVAVDGELELLVDVRLIQSALSNLVRNAIKFTHHAGKISIRSKATPSRATIEIEDACGGLPEGDVERMFSPFVQLGAGAARGDGFGLGLAIARQAISAHGGNLRVQNLPKHGCIFVLELPAAPPAS